jgi:uncharacterized phage protein (TIGR02218 family)
VKTPINLNGDLAGTLAAIINGSPEPYLLPMRFLYLLYDQTGFGYQYTDHGHDLTVSGTAAGNGATFYANQLQFLWPAIENVAGSQDSKCDVTCFPCTDNATSLPVAQKFFFSFQQGLFDGCRFYVYQCFLSGNPLSGETPIGLVLAYLGFIGEVKVTRSKIKFTANSLLYYANVHLPKNMYQPSCSHALYDSGCTLNINSFSYPVSVTAVDPSLPQQVLWVNVLNYGIIPGLFTGGVVKFTSGLNAGLIRTIKQDFGDHFSLMNPLPNTPSPGDQVTAILGCDKTTSTCQNVFNNLVHYRGTPYLPNEQIFY